jgi:hypothetical protein
VFNGRVFILKRTPQGFLTLVFDGNLEPIDPLVLSEKDTSETPYKNIIDEDIMNKNKKLLINDIINNIQILEEMLKKYQKLNLSKIKPSE